MLRLMWTCILGTTLTMSAMAAPFGGDGTPVAPKLYQVGQLVKCSYKGRFESTKTVECQLKQGLNKDSIWKFSAAENHWKQLEKLAGQQVVTGYRKGGIKHMEADFSLVSLKAVTPPPPRKSVCKLPSPKDSYSVGFRVARIMAVEDKSDTWQVQAQPGGEGNLDLWPFEISQKKNSACHQKLLELMAGGESHTFYYLQEGKNDEYQIWRID